MPNKSLSTALVALIAGVAPLAAQEYASCSGPGAAFGVTSYQCASCSIKQTPGARTQYIFQSEPIVLEAVKTSALQPGDVIEAVNGEPIMSVAGMVQFTYPRAGKSIVTVRRGNARVQVAATTVECDASLKARPEVADSPLMIVDGSIVSDLNQVETAGIESVDVLKGPTAVALYGPRAAKGVIVIATKRGTTAKPKPGTPVAPKSDPLIIIDGVVQPSPTPDVDVNQSSSGRRFGFAIGCLPSCTRTKTASGTEYYQFDGYPPVVALTAGGPAERAGIRLGDLISQIDGRSILGEEGALRFLRGDKTETLHVTVLRDRQSVGYLLTAR
jgi:TonB-dependent SusC/RagA subfamily outer membrane receptor